MSTRCLVGLMSGVLVVCGLAASPATGAGPTFERIHVDDTFVDEFLSQECGIDVTTTVRGDVIRRIFPGEQGLVEVNTVNFAVTATAGDRTFRFRNVGADNIRVTPDGTIVLLVTGQVPFEFAGVLKINPE